MLFPELFLKSNGTGPPLRIGVLIDGFEQIRVFQQVLEHIQRSNFASIELLVFNDPGVVEAPRPPQPKWKTLLDVLRDRKRRARLGYNLYEKFDTRFFPQENDPLDSVDCTSQLAGIDVLRVVPITKGFVHRLQADDIAKIREYNLDVVLRFGFNILKGDILTSAKYGIWSYHHGDNDYYRGGPPYFWELFERRELSGVILQVLTEELDGGKVLAKGLFSTAQGISIRRNRYTPYWGSVAFAIQKLFELHSYGWNHIVAHSVPAHPYQGKRKLYRTPTNAEMLAWFSREAAKTVWGRIKRAFTGKKDWEWRIGLRTQAVPSLLQSRAIPQDSFQWEAPPRGHFHADPFLVRRGDERWLFLEDYIYQKERGVLGCREIGADGALGAISTVLDKPYHLSYPFVFEDDGEMYMVPETKGNGSVELYKSTEFPYQWTLEKTLFHGKCVDTTLLVERGTYWFFTTCYAPYGNGQCLCLFYADSLTGEWQLHPCSPIKMDVRYARNAGRIFHENGNWYRVSQSGEGGYGASFSFHRIVTLNRTEYREELVKTVEPWFPFRGMHTYDQCDGVEVIDGLAQRKASELFVPAEFPPAAVQSDLPQVSR